MPVGVSGLYARHGPEGGGEVGVVLPVSPVWGSCTLTAVASRCWGGPCAQKS